MIRNAFLLGLLAVVLALPFIFRPAPDAMAAARSDETVVIISPHNEAIRHEFELGFRRWYRERTGREVRMDWRLIGGTSEINRYLEGEYIASFQNHWTGELGRPWSAEVLGAFANGRLPADASETAKAARAAFLASNVGSGIDLFFGGGTYDFITQARAGRLVPLREAGEETPDWMTEEIVPLKHAGDDYRDAEGRWTGAVLSSFGIVYNRDAIARLGTPSPRAWADLADPRYIGQVALADPTKSGSMNKAFENVVQQQIHRVVGERLATARFASEEARKAAEQEAVAAGWTEGLKLLQSIAANARYFTDSAQKVPIDVAAGNCAVGMCIDFYGRQQSEALVRRSGSDRVTYVSPPGGTVFSVDPIGMLRGAPNPRGAKAFVDFVMSPEGQRLWNQRPGTDGGPEHYALRRLPVRRDSYEEPGVAERRSDPEENPYSLENPLVYRPEWTAGLFGELRFILRVMCLDTHPELVAAWRVVNEAGRPPEAMAALHDLSAVDYEAAQGVIKAALRNKDKTVELKLARELGGIFRANYARAVELARAGR
ncbi:MAG: extracellular solute-binding protein [Opitutaceae bacterium]|jgi:ABC-type Fe3+ transport system substrate-binding protein|nr:extracellular solute-binding protein [Opitutaceae bacterium]